MTVIKDKRIEARISQEQLAYLLNVSLSTVRRWEKDLNCVPISKIKRLSDIFDCPIDDFFSDITSNKTNYPLGVVNPQISRLYENKQ